MAVNSYREDEFMENTDKKKIFRRLFSYLLEYKAILIGVLLCMAVTVAISLVNPLLIEEAIDHYIANKDMKGLMGLGLFALGLNIIFIIMVKIRMYVMAVVSNKILLRIRQDLYEHIQTLSFSFFDSRPTGKNSGENHRRREFAAGCAGKCGHNIDSGTDHGHRRCGDHAD